MWDILWYENALDNSRPWESKSVSAGPWLVTSVTILHSDWPRPITWSQCCHLIGQKSAAGHLPPSPGWPALGSLPIRAVRCRLLIDRYTQKIKHASPVKIRPREIIKSNENLIKYRQESVVSIVLNTRNKRIPLFVKFCMFHIVTIFTLKVFNVFHWVKTFSKTKFPSLFFSLTFHLISLQCCNVKISTASV